MPLASSEVRITKSAFITFLTLRPRTTLLRFPAVESWVQMPIPRPIRALTEKWGHDIWFLYSEGAAGLAATGTKGTPLYYKVLTSLAGTSPTRGVMGHVII